MTFLEKNLNSFTKLLRTSLFAQSIAKQPGLLQRLDPRTKIICFVLILLCVNSSRHLVFILATYVVLLFFAYVSKIPLKFFFTRVWMFLPFFTGIIAIPVLFNIVTPGKTIVTIMTLPNHFSLSITDTGLTSALFLVTRVATSVSSAMLIVLTTAWADLLKALEYYHIPRIFIVICMMTYRYIFVLLETLSMMFLAKKSRLVGKLSNRDMRGTISSTVGVLFGKTYYFSEEVYKAMRSRGFRDTIHIYTTFAFRAIDLTAIAVTGTFLGAAWVTLK